MVFQKDESIENELFNGRAGFLGAILWLRKIIDPRMFMDLSQHKIQEICQFLLFTGARFAFFNFFKLMTFQGLG